MADEMIEALYPYRDRWTVQRRIGAARPRAEVLAEIAAMAQREDAAGDVGLVSGSLYSGDHDHYAFLTEVFGLYAHANVLQRDMYPSATKFEGEIVAMALDLLHGGDSGCGVVTGGGSESLITALYAYREEGRAKGITRPNVVLPETAHVAVWKGAHWLDVEVRSVPVAGDLRADVPSIAQAMDDNTVALYASAGNYPHGVVDPIGDIAELAASAGVGLHVDGCLGGFILPWMEELGVPVPPWDFRVRGVTSISADTHKYGYALKGTSVLMYRDAPLRARQYFAAGDWPGGLYVSPGFAGSRSGGLLASTWAAMVTTGDEGYRASADRIRRATESFAAAVSQTAGLRLLGDPIFMVAFAADDPELDIYLVNDAMTAAGWRLNALQNPPALHLCVTGPNTAAGLPERFAADLQAAVTQARAQAGQPSRSGALYGLGATPAGLTTLEELMRAYLDATYSLPPDAA